MDPEPSDGNDSAKTPASRPRMILHANEGTVATSHPGILRKRSAVIVLVALTIGVGATTYAAVTANQNCQPDPNNPNNPNATTCNRSSSSGSRYSFIGSNTSDSSPSRSTSPSATSTPRAGFGAHGAIHGSASS